MKAKAIELVENLKSRSMMEKQPRYDIILHGKIVGELYYNMKGYVGYLPLPNGSVFNCGERGISQWKREASKANQEWTSSGELDYYELRLNRTKPIDDSTTAKEIAAMRNTETVVCKPFQCFSSEEELKNAIASGNGLLEYITNQALTARKIQPEEVNYIEGVCRIEEPDYWKKQLVQH